MICTCETSKKFIISMVATATTSLLAAPATALAESHFLHWGQKVPPGCSTIIRWHKAHNNQLIHHRGNQRTGYKNKWWAYQVRIIH